MAETLPRYLVFTFEAEEEMTAGMTVPPREAHAAARDMKHEERLGLSIASPGGKLLCLCCV